MKVYRIYIPVPQGEDDTVDHYEGTLSGAHSWVKKNLGKHLWKDALIEEREVITDKAALIELLNGVPRFEGSNSTKVWGLTVRGGLEVSKE